MKILRSVNRRGSTIGTAGYFTVLRANTWFAATRFPDRFHNLRERAEEAARQPAQGQDISTTPNQSAMHLELKPQPEPLHWMRSALIVLLASGITMFLLWWVFVRPHPVF
jgi:hypothetical protein